MQVKKVLRAATKEASPKVDRFVDGRFLVLERPVPDRCVVVATSEATVLALLLLSLLQLLLLQLLLLQLLLLQLLLLHGLLKMLLSIVNDVPIVRMLHSVGTNTVKLYLLLTYEH